MILTNNFKVCQRKHYWVATNLQRRLGFCSERWTSFARDIDVILCRNCEISFMKSPGHSCWCSACWKYLRVGALCASLFFFHSFLIRYTTYFHFIPSRRGRSVNKTQGTKRRAQSAQWFRLFSITVTISFLKIRHIANHCLQNLILGHLYWTTTVLSAHTSHLAIPTVQICAYRVIQRTLLDFVLLLSWF